MRVAALDLGSNTFILLIAEVDKGQIKKVIVDETKLVRLGQNLFETGEFHPEALERVKECFSEFRKLIDKHQVEKIVAVATSASRDAKNKDEFFALGEKYRIPINVITGDLEAKLTYQGARENEGSFAVIDVGGGSTEVVGKNKDGVLLKHSFDLGCVRLNEKYIKRHPVMKPELKQLEQFIEDKLLEKKEFLSQLKGNELVAVAGTPTTVADMMLGGGFDREKIDNAFIPIEDWNILFQSLCGLSTKQRLKIPGMTKGREDVIISGMLILSLLAKNLGAKGFNVSTRGVRYGLAIEASINADL
ncbi:MAG: hypothetical protein A4S09_14695 [Proteobacteria bacterium SG_bin7]|nr:MAG: hypothetical protein A4S09_14695 [Proteobacteria bacterium SG_bin7]